MTRKLYELANVESPFVWRAKYALAHKGLTYESERLPFTQISPGFGNGGFKTVPVLVEEDGEEIHDSWAIAKHLDAAYPQAPTLLGDGLERAQAVESLLGKVGFRNFLPIFIKDIHDGLASADAVYFRENREARFGDTLENLSADRDVRLPQAREALGPLRAELADAQWLHGDAPGYGDYIWLGFFAWLTGCASCALLLDDDPLKAYIERGFALFDGVAHGISSRAGA
ncbi:MAG: glutathione S-transferase N-terminal domain-containing protein [Pseudomonadota bacterium]